MGKKKSRKKNKEYLSIRFWADIVTILSIIIVLIIFFHNSCNEKIKSRNEYINQLEAIDFELNANSILVNHIVDTEDYTKGETFPWGRLFVDVLKGAIVNGRIENDTIRIKFYEILQRENQINTILDTIPNKQTSVSSEMQVVIKNSRDLKDMFPKIRRLITEHKRDIEKTHAICDSILF